VARPCGDASRRIIQQHRHRHLAIGAPGAIGRGTPNTIGDPAAIGEGAGFPWRWERAADGFAATFVKRSGMEPSISSGVKGRSSGSVMHQGGRGERRTVLRGTIRPEGRDLMPEACPSCVRPAESLTAERSTWYGAGQYAPE